LTKRHTKANGSIFDSVKSKNFNTMSNEEKDIQQEENIFKNEESAKAEDTNEVSKEESLEVQISELNDKYLRLYSEFDNYRKRTSKERIELIGTASEKIIKELLPIVDDFKRAQKNNSESTDFDAIKQGFDLIFDKFYKTLLNTGLTEMNSMGEVFDADKHEALTNIPAPSEDMKGKVIDVIEEGYYLNDKIVRFAKVVVGN
jgi:molecular chaperone GrpE